MRQTFSDFYNKVYLNEDDVSFKNLHQKAVQSNENKTKEKSKSEDKACEIVGQENPIVTQLKKKIDLLYKNYGEMGLRMVDESIIKSHEKLKKILSNIGSNDTCEEEVKEKSQQPKKIKIKKKIKPSIQKRVVVVKHKESEDREDEENVIFDNEGYNTTNIVANSLPNVFPSNNNTNQETEEDNEEEEEVVEHPKEKKNKKQEVEKTVENMNIDELYDMLYEKSVEYTHEHPIEEENFDEIPDFLGDDNTQMNENNIPRVNMDNISGDDMEALAEQFC